MKHRFVIRMLRWMGLTLLLGVLLCLPVFATGDVSGAIEGTWNTAQGQIKTVVNNVVFPVIDMILAIMFFVKLGTAYFDYRKHGHDNLHLTARKISARILGITRDTKVRKHRV